MAFCVDLIWFVLHVVAKARLATSECTESIYRLNKLGRFAAVQTFSNVLEGSVLDPFRLRTPRALRRLGVGPRFYTRIRRARGNRDCMKPRFYAEYELLDAPVNPGRAAGRDLPRSARDR